MTSYHDVIEKISEIKVDLEEMRIELVARIMKEGKRISDEDHYAELTEVMLMCALLDEQHDEVGLKTVSDFLRKKTYRFRYLTDGANSLITTIIMEVMKELQLNEEEINALKTKSRPNETKEDQIIESVLYRHFELKN